MDYMTKPVFGIMFKQVMLSFASGGLLGDVFLHIIPHISSIHAHKDTDHNRHHDNHHEGDSHDHHHAHAHQHKGPCTCGKFGVFSVIYRYLNTALGGAMNELWEQVVNNHHGKTFFVGISVLLGFFAFFAAERIGKVYFSHSHDQAIDIDNPKDESNQTRKGRSRSVSRSSKSGSKSKSVKATSISVSNNSNSAVIKGETKTSKTSTSEGFLHNLEFSGWLNLAADSMHNFTDGIAIGVAYSVTGAVHSHGHHHTHTLGFVTALSVLFHEVPHEIGDFVTLINSGMTKYQAIKAQFVTAIFAFLGTFFGLMIGDADGNLGDLFICFTAGGFLYIATCNMLSSSIVMSIEKNTDVNETRQVIFDCAGFATGVFVMFCVALLE